MLPQEELQPLRSIDYKRELERAAKTMLLVHNPNTLMRMIVRTIVQKVKVSHASILLFNKEHNTFILNVSRGPMGLKVPEGFTRMDLDNPLIRFFRERKDRLIFNNDLVKYDEARNFMEQIADSGLKQILHDSLYQMEIFETVAVIPSYYKDNLLGILLLGKKKDGSEFGTEELNFFIALAHDVAMAIRNAQLFQDLETELEKKQSLFFHTTIALAAAIDAKDHYTHGHTTRVTNVSLEIAKRMAEKNKSRFEGKFFENVHIASLLHDIGKIGVPESILNKVEPLTESERAIIKDHPMIGVNILKPIQELEICIEGVKYHHERFDGKGYPEGLKGDRIPVIAAIIAVADCYDAMISNRPYRRSMTKEQAIEEIKRCSGSQFDPAIVEIFLELYQEGIV